MRPAFLRSRSSVGRAVVMKEPETVAENGVNHSAGRWFESNRERHPGSPGMYDTLLSMTARKDEKSCAGVGYRHGHIRKISVMVAQRSRKPTWRSAMVSWGFESSIFRHRSCLDGGCATKPVSLSCNGCLRAAQDLLHGTVSITGTAADC